MRRRTPFHSSRWRSPVTRFSISRTGRRASGGPICASPKWNQNSFGPSVKRDGDGDGIVAVERFLDEADHVRIVGLQKAQIGGLQQRRVLAADRVELVQIGLDVAGLVPVARPDLVFLGIDIFLAAGQRLVFDQFEAVIDAVIGRQRRRERRARLEQPGFAGLQLHRQNVRRRDEKIRPVIFAFRIAGQFAQIFLQLGLGRAPGEISIGLREAELGERLHHLRAGEGFGQEDHARIARLHLADRPFPERQAAWCADCRCGKCARPDRPRTAAHRAMPSIGRCGRRRRSPG